jgi:bacterioferritin-associated ferredoxin
MIVCICHRVSDRDIARAARDGCASFDDLQLETGIATCCGKCHDCARQTFELHASAASAAASDTAVCFAHPARSNAAMTPSGSPPARHTATATVAANATAAAGG